MYGSPENEKKQETVVLTNAQVEIIADKAVEKMQQKLFIAVGKSVVTKLFYIIGMIAVGVYMWLKSKGWVE